MMPRPVSASMKGGTMFPNLLLQFLKKAIYGVLGNAGAMLSTAIVTHQPIGDPVTIYLWQGLAVGAFTGLAALLKRWAGWDPTKAFKP
jgi:hypothetical protein